MIKRHGHVMLLIKKLTQSVEMKKKALVDFFHHQIVSQTRKKCPTSGGAVLRSKLVGGRCQVQTPVVLVDLAVRSFPWFSPKLA